MLILCVKFVRPSLAFCLDPYSQDGEKQFHLQIVDFKGYDLKNLLEMVMQTLCTVSVAQGLHGSFLIALAPLSILLLYFFPAKEILTEGSL